MNLGVKLALAIASCAVAAVAQDQPFKDAFALYQSGSLAQAQGVLLKAIETKPSALDYSLLGSIELQQGRIDSAEEHLRQALAMSPGLPGTRLTLATLLEAKGDKAAARRAFSEVLSRDSKNLTALLDLSKLDLEAHQLGTAAALLERANKIAPDDVRVLLSLARVRNLQGNSEGALALLLDAKRAKPDDPDVLYGVGVLCLQMDLVKDANANLERAVQLQPGNANARYALASARIADHDLPGAITIYQDLLKSDPGNAQVNYALGATYFLASNIERAKTYLDESVKLEPGQVESLYYLALIAHQQGDDAESLKLLNTVIERQPDHARAHVALGMQYRSQGKLPQAEAELEKAVRLDPQSQKAHYQLGLVLTALKQQERAKAELGLASRLRAETDDKVSWELLPSDESRARAPAQGDDGQRIQSFEASIKAGQYSQIRESLASYATEHPQSWRALYQLGYVYFRLHLFQESLSALSKSLVINDNFAEAHKILAFDLNILGRKDLAISELQKAISLEPESFECHYELGRIYFDAGFYVKAVEQLVRARELDPSAVKVYHNLGLAYSAVGDNGKAVENFEEGLRLNSQQAKPSAWPLIDYAAYFNSQNNFKKAKDLLIEARRIDAGWDQEFDELSKAYRGLGEMESAIDALKHAIAINPQKAEYHYALARLYSQTDQQAQAKEELAEYEKDRQKSKSPN